jgi:hypothetical protein
MQIFSTKSTNSYLFTGSGVRRTPYYFWKSTFASCETPFTFGKTPSHFAKALLLLEKHLRFKRSTARAVRAALISKQVMQSPIVRECVVNVQSPVLYRKIS